LQTEAIDNLKFRVMMSQPASALFEPPSLLPVGQLAESC